MSTGFSLLLIAAGAVLAFAVTYESQGVDIQTIGVILLIVGIVGLTFSLLFLASFAPFGRHDRYIERTTTSDRAPDPVTRDRV
jgi:uncharacterized protein DUF6458